jgi:TATA-box binding protein (TBP) (component of TFIID and TFIIIB)
MTAANLSSKDMDRDIAKAVSEIQMIETTHNNVTKPFRINTITILLQLGSINFRQFLEVCMQDDPLPKLGLQESEWSLNCSPIVFFLKNKLEGVSIKIFRNGNLHLTGIKSVTRAVHHGTQLCNVLQQFSTENLQVKKFNIQLINGAFKFNLEDNTAFCLTKIFSEVKNKISQSPIDKDVTIDCLFNTDYHSALKIKFNFTQTNNKTTVSIFKSGSVLIQSFRNGQQLLVVYKFITNFVCEHFDTITTFEFEQKNKRKRNFDYSSYL